MRPRGSNCQATAPLPASCPPVLVKMDRTSLRRLPDDKPTVALVEALVHFAARTDIRLVATGIETDHLPAALPDGPARLFVRPEDLTPIPDPAGPWTIASATNTGAQLRLVLSDGAGTEIPADLRRRSPRAAQLSPGARVHLRPEHASVFPAEIA